MNGQTTKTEKTNKKLMKKPFLGKLIKKSESYKKEILFNIDTLQLL